MKLCIKCRSKHYIISCTVYEKGEHHSYNDKPAIIYDDFVKMWCSNGKAHRENKPAKTWPDGTREWLLNNELHRNDGPACQYPGSADWWCLKGERAELILKENLYLKKVIQIKGITAIVIEKINDCWYEILIGDEKKLVVSLDKYKEG